MKKGLTKIVGLALGLALAVGVGVGIANGNSATPLFATPLKVASFSRDGSTNNTTGGTFTYAASGQSGYFQDGGSTGDTRYLQILNNNAYWTTTPLSISLTAKIGGGTGNRNLDNSVNVVLLGSGGSVLSTTTITNHITTNTGDTYSNISITPVNNVYGIKISHVKEAGYNVRYYSFDLYYESAVAYPTEVSVTGDMSNKSYTTVDSWNNSGLTPEVTMSNSSPYSGPIEWSYSYASPGEYAKTNGDEVTGGTVRATATVSGVSGFLDVTGINVSYANVAQLTAATPEESNVDLAKVVARGIISQIDEVSISNHNATYYISDDGTTTNQYKVFRGKNINNTNFENEDDIHVGDIVVVYGTITNYNGTSKQFKQGNYLLSLESTAPSISITESNFSLRVGDEDYTVHATPENVPAGGLVVWESNNTDVASVSETAGDYKVHAVAVGSATITAKILNSSSETLASDSIIVTVFDNALVNGDVFVIRATRETTNYYFTGVENNAGTVSTSLSSAMYFVAIESAAPGQFRLRSGDQYLQYYGSSNNAYLTNDGGDSSTLWTILTNGSNEFIESVDVSGRRLQFNWNNGSPKFACYASNQTAINVEKIDLSTSVELSYTDYTDNGDGSFSFTNMAIRFGGVLPKYIYDSLNGGNSVVAYGILFSTPGYLNGTPLKEFYNDANVVKKETTRVGESLVPSYSDPNCGWKYYRNVTSFNYKTGFVAVAYIKLSDVTIFFEQTEVTSVKSLAHDLIESGTYQSDAFGGSLNYLANLA